MPFFHSFSTVGIDFRRHGLKSRSGIHFKLHGLNLKVPSLWHTTILMDYPLAQKVESIHTVKIIKLFSDSLQMNFKDITSKIH